MGFGMGAAIGAHFASGDTCLVVTGDGSFNMNMNELTTAVKHHVPLVVAVMNNNALGMIRKLQTARKVKGSTSTWTTPPSPAPWAREGSPSRRKRTWTRR